MSLNTKRLRQAIHQKLEGELGGTRRVKAGRLQRGGRDGLAAETLVSRALALPRIGITIEGFRNSGSTPVSGLAPVRLVELDVTILFTYHLPAETSEDELEELLAQMVDDGDDAAQALAYPNSLSTTVDGLSTALASGQLLGPGSEGTPTWERLDTDYESNMASARLLCRGIYEVTQAT